MCATVDHVRDNGIACGIACGIAHNDGTACPQPRQLLLHGQRRSRLGGVGGAPAPAWSWLSIDPNEVAHACLLPGGDRGVREEAAGSSHLHPSNVRHTYVGMRRAPDALA